MRSASLVGRTAVAAASAAARRRGHGAVARSASTTVGDMHPPGDARQRTVTVLPGHGCVAMKLGLRDRAA